jgi:hypothetical protein
MPKNLEDAEAGLQKPVFIGLNLCLALPRRALNGT